MLFSGWLWYLYRSGLPDGTLRSQVDRKASAFVPCSVLAPAKGRCGKYAKGLSVFQRLKKGAYKIINQLRQAPGLAIIVPIQLVIGVGLCWFFSTIGAFNWVIFAIILLICFAIADYVYFSPTPPGKLKRPKVLRFFMVLAFAPALLLYLALLSEFFDLLPHPGILEGLILWVIFPLVFVCVTWSAIALERTGKSSILRITTYLFIAPVAYLWTGLYFSGSELTSIHTGPSDAVNRWNADAGHRSAVVAERIARWRACSLSNSTRPRVAILVSGGGYRASAFHAGAFHALERQCIHIDYMTTVSGGSIFGAYYTLGYKPQEFADLLRQRRPGQVYDRLNPFNLLLYAFGDKNVSDVYADHFARVFFHTATLDDLPDQPRLLINATDYLAPAYLAREVFYKDRAEGPQRMALNGTRIADVVAASGAFPGAFDEKRIAWLPAQTPTNVDSKPTTRYFIDGGVVENFGLEGLMRYFAIESTKKSPPHPLTCSSCSMPAPLPMNARPPPIG